MIIALGDIILRIAPNVVEVLEKFVQNDNNKNEAGGILIGYYIDDYSYYISDLSTPKVGDISTRFSFLRSHINAQRLVKQMFKLSKGKKIYLGEWHTHPEDLPTPSFTDLTSIKDQFTTNVLNSKSIFMVIMGIKAIYVGVYDKAGLINQTQIEIGLSNSSCSVN